MSSNVTIADVARAANVSTATVSRILNNKPDVARTTRERVMSVIRELGYEPHAPARSLAAGKGRMIALLYPPHDPEFSQPELGFFISAATAAREQGFFVNLITDLFTENGLLNVYRSAQMDGIILTQIHLKDWRVELLNQYGYPFVMIGRRADNTGLSYVDLDSEQAITVAFEHLVALEHHRIGFINFPTKARLDGCEGFGPAERSFSGYERIRVEHNLEAHYRTAQPTIEAVYRATLELLDEQARLTAIVTRHGASAVGIIRALQDRGKNIPGDCSVIAVTSDYLAKLITPPLTAIRFPSHELGYQAARTLIDQLQADSSEATQLLLKPELIVRESTGPAP